MAAAGALSRAQLDAEEGFTPSTLLPPGQEPDAEGEGEAPAGVWEGTSGSHADVEDGSLSSVCPLAPTRCPLG